MKWYEMTTEEFGRLVDEKTLVVVPFGILEEHGPHLPLGTDTIQVLHLVDMVEEELEKKGIKTVVAPPVHYGQSNSTRAFPGTISIKAETLYMLTKDILLEIVRQGMKNIVLISGHAGSQHMKAIERAANEIVEADASEDLKMMVLSDYHIAYQLLGKMGIPEDDGHAGTIETARVFEVREDLVRKEKIKDIKASKPFPKFRILKHPEKYIPDGVIGEPPLPNSLGMGKEINSYILNKLLQLIFQMLEQ